MPFLLRVHRVVRLTAALATLVAFVPAPARAGWSTSPLSPMPVCPAAGLGQTQPATCADGAGGVFLTWQDSRSGTHIYAQHLDAHGNPLWAAAGVPVCLAANTQGTPAICRDGAGGVFIAWSDTRTNVSSADIYVQRLGPAGAPVTGWAVNGAILSYGTNDLSPLITADGSGGAYVAWTAVFSGSDSDPAIARITPTGPTWILTGTGETHIQTPSSLVVSGGNAYLLWLDSRSTYTQLYGQIYTAAGTILQPLGGTQFTSASVSVTGGLAVPLAANGIAFACEDGGGLTAGTLQPSGWSTTYLAPPAGGARAVTAMTTDGFGGYFLLFNDTRSGTTVDVYGIHMLGAGGLAPGWSYTGNLILANAYSLTGVADGVGGVLIDCWSATGNYRYMQHIDGTGAVWPGWPSAGRLSTVGTYLGTAVEDGAQGAIITICNYTNGFYALYAQRVERFSQLGEPGPAITGVKDVRNDQGGSIKVSWNASSLDVPPGFTIGGYDLWRSIPAAAAARALSSGARAVTPDAVPGPRDAGVRLIIPPSGATATAWEYVGREPAGANPAYSYLVPTMADSIAGSNPYTLVKVRALPVFGAYFWESAPDSGYSVDNLPPAIPAPFAGTYAAGSASLHWSPSTAPDFARFRLYRGTSAAFVPSAGNLVAAQPDTGFVDVAGSPFYYKLAAEDAHGNLSSFATLLPSGTADVGGAVLPRVVFLAPVSPNPAREGAMLRFGLPSAARAELALFDAAGRRVRSLASGDLAAGEHAIRWDGLGDAGTPVASGLLFLRLETGDRTLVQRMVVVR